MNNSGINLFRSDTAKNALGFHIGGMVHFFFMQKEIFIALFLSLIWACMGPPQVENPRAWDEVSTDTQRVGLTFSAEQIARQYRYRIGSRKFSNDCSGFIGAVLYQNGIDVFKGATVLQMRGYGVQLLH